MATSYQSRLGSSPEEGTKAPVWVLTTSNINLYGIQNLEGITGNAGKRIAVAAQADATENGIYDMSVGAWERSTDFNDKTDVVSGVLVPNNAGGVFANSSIYMTNLSTDEFVPGVTEITFTKALSRSGYGDADVTALNLINGVHNATAYSNVFEMLAYPEHIVGTKVKSGLTTWLVESVSQPMTLADFKALSTVFLVDFSVASYTDYGDIDLSCEDATEKIHLALSAGPVQISSGVYCIKGTTVVGDGQALHISSGCSLVKPDGGNTDPVVWVNGGHASLTGDSTNSLIRSKTRSPQGVVRLGHENMIVSNKNVLYCTIKDLGIYGHTEYGSNTDDPDIGLWMPNPQTGGLASYFHNIDNILMSHLNIGLYLQGNANANTIGNLQFIKLGGNNVGMDNGAIILDGAKENMISKFFVHFSPNVRSLVLRNQPSTSCQLNVVTDWVVEPGTGGTAQGMVVESCGVGNTISGVLNGVGNDYGTAPDGFFGANKRNTWKGVNSQIHGSSLTIRTPSSALVLDDTDSGGQRYSILNSSQTLRIRNTDDQDLFQIDRFGTVYPILDGTQNLGAANYRLKQIFATNSAISTSDRRDKQQVRSLSEKEKAVAIKLKNSIKAFKWNKSVESEGDKARTHVGVMAQEVKAAFESEDLNGFDYGLLCFDAWDSVDEVTQEGQVATEAVEAGGRFGVRYEQLLAFVIAAML